MAYGQSALLSDSGAAQLQVVLHVSHAEHVRALMSCRVSLVTVPSFQDRDVTDVLEHADVFITTRFTSAMAATANRLRLIQVIGAGVDDIDVTAVPPRATVCNVYGHESAISEYVVMTMLALNRELVALDRRLREGDWGDRLPQRELRGRTLVVVGLGPIGAALARTARVLGMRVLGITRRPDSQRQVELGAAWLGEFDDLHRVLPEADFLVLAVPLTDRTRGLIGAQQLRAMRSSAYLINVARGPVVEEAALYEALRDKSIAGAAIDVWYRYPSKVEARQPSDYPFHELDNVLMTPHVAGWTEGTMRYRWQFIADNVCRLAGRERLLNVVIPARDPAGAGGLSTC